MSRIKVEPWCDDKCLPPKVTSHERVRKLISPNIIGCQNPEINLSKNNWGKATMISPRTLR